MSRRGFSTAIIILIGIAVLAFGFFYYLNQKSDLVSPPEIVSTQTTEPAASTSSENFEAKFEIYTLGTKRQFGNAMYLGQSEDAYLTSDDPSVVHVEKSGITWQEFFDTLPFQIDKECLHTGTSQTFCTDKDGTLKFFLNGDETSNALSAPIMPGDSLVVRYE